MAFLQDQIFIGGTIISFMFIAIFGLLLVSNINTGFAGNDPYGAVNDFDTQLPGIIDWIFGLLFIGLPLIALGLAFVNFIPSFFYWLAMLVNAVITILGFALQAMYNSTVASGQLANTVSRIPVTDFFMSNMGYYSVIVWLILAIGTYVKFNPSIGGGY